MNISRPLIHPVKSTEGKRKVLLGHDPWILYVEVRLMNIHGIKAIT